MRIAFVGKGGSGKTTISSLFALYLKNTNKPILAIDADINMHMWELLGFDHSLPVNKQLSNPEVTEFIKNYLKGNNTRIKELSHFRKTTPPTNESNFLYISDNNNSIMSKFSLRKDNLSFMAVGTYDPDGIGASCYHNNLAILESLLSHTIDKSGYLIVDMVAGTDAFANTLHAQFDLLVLVIEPTRKGVDVFNHYYELAKSAKIEDQLLIIGNKVKDESDIEFIKNSIPSKLLLGFFSDSNYLRKYEQNGNIIDVNLLEPENKKILKEIETRLNRITPDYDKRLRMLYDLHLKYVSQNNIKTQFGDLTNQIDSTFKYERVLNEQK